MTLTEWFGELVETLRAAQNPDGGWGYRQGVSWTEPTVFALLALRQRRPDRKTMARGMAWLARCRRPEGGWAPHPSVRESTWVTAPAVALLAGSGEESVAGGVRWLLAQSGAESAWPYRLMRRLRGAPAPPGGGATGWSWFPGTAGWVAPTALTVLALEAAGRGVPAAAERIAMGRRFLLARICPDGGWNYGPPRVLGYDAPSYPETTGLALLALHGETSPRIARALAKAERDLERPLSAQAFAWLTLALAAHGRKAPACPPPAPHNLLDAALLALAAAGPRALGRPHEPG